MLLPNRSEQIANIYLPVCIDSTNDIAEILLKVALNTINQIKSQINDKCSCNIHILYINVRENWRGNQTIDNPEKLAALGTQDTCRR